MKLINWKKRYWVIRMVTKFEKTKVGDVVAFIYYTKVKEVFHGDGYRTVNPSLNVTDLDRGEDFSVRGLSLIETGLSADNYSKVVEVTRTELAEKLTQSYNVPFTVVFTKQNKEKRKLRGRLIRPEPLLGRSKVEDLDIEKGNRERLVDHRTIESLIVNDTLYVVK